MRKHLSIRLAVALLNVAPLAASAQQFNTIPSGTVIGRTAIGAGPAQIIPIQQLFSTLLTGPLSVPSVNTNSVIYKGSTSGQATVSAQAVAGTPTLLLPNTSGTLASNATSPIVLNATTGNISCPSCLSVANATPVLASRAFALTQNLSTLAAVRTLGYAAAGDGGGAVFKNIGTSPFIDSFVTGFTITGGSGYTSGGPYYGVLFSNGTKPYLVGTLSVSGGAITAVNIAGSPGNQCAVGDVYTIGGSAAATAFPANGLPTGGTGGSITVTSCSTPLASFTDSVGTHFQFVPEGFGPALLQFGAKGDWNGTDGTATDNFSAIQAALWFASFKSSTTSDGGGFSGGRVIAPTGSYLLCGTGLKSLIVPSGVIFEGPSAPGSASLRICDVFNQSVHFIELCDPNWHFACFDSSLRNLSLSNSRVIPSAIGTAMVHSNATQDFGGLSRVYIYSGERECVNFEKGFGGASSVVLEYVSCNISSSAGNPGLVFGNTVASGLNYGTTMIKLDTIVLSGPSSGTLMAGSGMVLKGGFYDIQNVHCEAIPTCVFLQIPSATGNGDIVRMHNINAGGGPVTCTGVITLDSANRPGNLIVGQVPAGSCINVVTNGQPSGSNRTTAITSDVTFNP